MNKPVAWSYSALDAFETCPKRYYLTKVAKVVVEPQSQAMKWGNEVHKALEHRLVAGTALPETMVEYEPIAARVAEAAKGGKLQAEQKMAINVRYVPTTWFAKDVWARGITDFQITKGDKMFIGDWKTGAPKPESAQLKLTAAMAMHHNPNVKTVINTFVWLKTGEATTEKFTREDIPTIWQEFAPRVQRLEYAVADNKFPARPSGLCRAWCPVGKANCEHCGT